ncbi:outer membrane lipoprotein carrier protein LolA [Desulfotalea psychrophila]|uniref:Outer membrane lipoprotein carrier protein LolA n=1 Tax=Desulfotalea psychrophila (strain LSv54 / DSM 12343) TaxID=177439 RepID=Q6AM51_DESPS|nr:outer membrane lipoprotein carrier protein LolA [Desulfotalea psychrophila]CAG36574.1 unknown protein [Desulfotalea psychrophila LSv54]
MLKKIILTLFFCLVASMALASEEEELNTFLHKIQQTSRQAEAFSTDFIQEKHLAMLNKPVIFRGHLSLIRPDKLRWQFTSPLPSALIFNGEQGMRCDSEGEATPFLLSSDPVMRVVAEQLWNWLGGDYLKLSKLYRLSKMEPASLVIHFDKEGAISKILSRVTIRFNEKSLQPEQVKIVERGGDFTRIFFKNPQLNIPLADDLFSRCDINE